MADALHRTTKELRKSIHTPDCPVIDWIVNPDLSAVVSIPKKYWKIVGDVVSEMTQAEKDNVDAGLLPDYKKAVIARIRSQLDGYMAAHYDPNQIVALNAYWTEGVSKSWTNRNALVQSVLDWINSVVDHFYAKRTEVNNATTIAGVDAVTTDFAQFDATDPNVKVKTVKDTVN